MTCKKPVVYVGHPIRGIMGADASLYYVQQNCDQAVRNVHWLRDNFPDTKWYCPAEHDLLIQILYQAGRMSETDILWGDCEIIRTRCDGYFGHKWERSGGIDVEAAAAQDAGKPCLVVEWGPDLANRGNRLAINDFLTHIYMEVYHI